MQTKTGLRRQRCDFPPSPTIGSPPPFFIRRRPPRMMRRQRGLSGRGRPGESWPAGLWLAWRARAWEWLSWENPSTRPTAAYHGVGTAVHCRIRQGTRHEAQLAWPTVDGARGPAGQSVGQSLSRGPREWLGLRLQPSHVDVCWRWLDVLCRCPRRRGPTHDTQAPGPQHAPSSVTKWAGHASVVRRGRSTEHRVCLNHGSATSRSLAFPRTH